MIATQSCAFLRSHSEMTSLKKIEPLYEMIVVGR